MNKTIIININGSVFHIEEDAYEILKAYMTDVKRHFFNSADSMEITTDIENRIAEMFSQQLLTNSRQVITEVDVKEVVAQMGSVDDFDLGEGASAAGSVNYSADFNSQNRKLFRDPDDHILGGVCAGLGSYFDVETVWVRLAFAVAFLAGGTGLLAYIVLWVVVPRAASRADRMSMRGEPLDLQGFKRNFEEGMSGVKGHLATLHDEARPLLHKTRSYAGSAVHHTGAAIGSAGRLLAKIIAVFIAISCVLGIASVLIGIVAFVGYGVTSFGPGGVGIIFPISVMDYQGNWLFFAAAFLVIALPLFAIMFVVLSAAFNRARFTKPVGSTLLLLWLASVCIVTFYGTRLAGEFREGASYSRTTTLKADSTQIYYLKLNDVKYLTADDSARLNIKANFNGRIINDDNNDAFDRMGYEVRINIEKGDVKQPVLEETYSARGRSYEDALANTRGITYFFNQKNNVMLFNNRLQIGAQQYWRNQEIHLTLKVPVNSKLVIDDNLTRYLRDIDIWDCRDRYHNDSRTDAEFLMTENGLKCLADTAKATPANPTAQ